MPAVRHYGIRIDIYGRAYMFFGHVHSAGDIEHTAHTIFVNAALAGEFGDLDKEPTVLRLR